MGARSVVLLRLLCQRHRWLRGFRTLHVPEAHHLAGQGGVVLRVELDADLGRWLDGEPIAAARPGLAESLGRLARRHRIAAVAVAAVTAAVLAGTAGVAIFALRADQARRESREFETIRSVTRATVGLRAVITPSSSEEEAGGWCSLPPLRSSPCSPPAPKPLRDRWATKSAPLSA
jgi:hypothetical protein